MKNTFAGLCGNAGLQSVSVILVNPLKKQYLQFITLYLQ